MKWKTTTGKLCLAKCQTRQKFEFGVITKNAFQTWLTEELSVLYFGTGTSIKGFNTGINKQVITEHRQK